MLIVRSFASRLCWLLFVIPPVGEKAEISPAVFDEPLQRGEVGDVGVVIADDERGEWW